MKACPLCGGKVYVSYGADEDSWEERCGGCGYLVSED